MGFNTTAHIDLCHGLLWLWSSIGTLEKDTINQRISQSSFLSEQESSLHITRVDAATSDGLRREAGLQATETDASYNAVSVQKTQTGRGARLCWVRTWKHDSTVLRCVLFSYHLALFWRLAIFGL